MKIVMSEGPMFGAKSSGTAEYATMAQVRLLKMLNTSRSEYSVVFTTGLKASYRLVANAYPFQKNSPSLFCQDNHDAINQVLEILCSNAPCYINFLLLKPSVEVVAVSDDSDLLCL